MYALKKIEEMKARFDDSGELSAFDKSFIESHYERISKKRFNNNGCGQCYHDAFIEMYVHVKKYGIKDMGQFILKREVLIHITGDPQVYTRANITDDIAIKYLKQFPNAINRFESYPDNLEDILSASAPVELDSENQIAAEKSILDDIVKMLKEGVSKTKIKEHYKSVEKVGEKMLSGVMVADFIKKADNILSASAPVGGVE